MTNLRQGIKVGLVVAVAIAGMGLLPGVGGAYIICQGSCGGGSGNQNQPAGCFSQDTEAYLPYQSINVEPYMYVSVDPEFDSWDCADGQNSVVIQSGSIAAYTNYQVDCLGGVCDPQPTAGAAEFNGASWWNVTTAGVASTASTSDGSAYVYFEVYYVNVDSSAPNGCDTGLGDSASGSGSLFLGLQVYSLTSGKAPIGYGQTEAVTLPTASCGGDVGTFGSGGEYFTTDTGDFEGASFIATVDGLTFTKGTYYQITAVVGCTMSGATWGSNMGSDTTTYSAFDCAISSGDYGFIEISSPTFNN